MRAPASRVRTLPASPLCASLAITAGGVPVHDQDSHVAGVLWVADQIPRQWSTSNVAVLETLAEIASGEVALRAVLARTLEESLLPPQRLPDIPGLEVAARCAAGGTGEEVLADFCDVFPSVGQTWGMAVGDVCGKGSAAAKSTALARYTLRAVARRPAVASPVTCTAMSGSAAWSPGSAA